jgi:hypothetical protein
MEAPVAEQMPTVRKVYSGIELLPDKENPTEFRLIREYGSAQEPPEMGELRRDYMRIVRLILIMFQNDLVTRGEMVRRTAECAEVGLVGDDYDFDLGRENLDSIKEDLADDAYRTRSEWLREYTRLALLVIFLPTFLIGAMFYATFVYFNLQDAKGFSAQITLLIAAFWIPAGAAFGVWIEFALRTGNQMKYESVLSMDPDRWQPAQRIIITIAVAFAFAFILGIKVIQVGLGTVLLNEFVDKRPEASLAIGGIAGLAFPYVRDLLTRLRPESRDATTKPIGKGD